MTDDALLTEILKRSRVVAVVGASLNPVRPSHYVARFLVQQGYRVIPVNPGHAGMMLFGEEVRARLAEVDAPVDMVDIFRRSDAVPEIVEDALEHLPHLRTIWMQLGVVHDGAAALARARGVDVVMNRCPKIEFPRLLGDAGL
ncbi:MAG TPA: CoA-binding protein [Citreicella sp.]|jgi:hypothetical protein|nr:CoA-binding protein [Citreicella sp.]